MARIVVVNPPKSARSARSRLKNKRSHVKGYYPNPKKRRFSAKARAAALRNLRKARAHSNPKRAHRRRRAAARLVARRRRRSKSFVNPFAGTLAIMGNPRRTHRRKHTMARRKHRRHHRRSLSNPFSANALLQTPKEMISSQFLMEAAGVAAGFVLPNMAMNYLPIAWRSSTMTYYASKVATVAVLSAAGSMVSKRIGKFVLVGGGVSLMLDLYTELTKGMSPAAVAPAATTPATQAFYGNLGAYYGGMLNGVGEWDV